MVTLKDIAAKANVNISTVSRVIQGAKNRVSEEKRNEILSIANELNYRPNAVARGLRLGRSGAVAMVVPSTTNYLYPEIVGGAEDAADEHGYVLFLLKQAPNQPIDRLLAVLGQGRVDGLLFADEPPEPEVIERFERERTPYICLNRSGNGDKRYVVLNDRAGFKAQGNYLLSMGHKEIAFVRGSPETYVTDMCLHAFQEGLQSHGLDLPPEKIISCDFGAEGCDAVADKLLALPRLPTAVATASVLVATRLVGVLKARGVRVPEEVSVIGYHDSPAAAWPPPGVNTVRMPSRSQGRQGMVRLIQVISGENFVGETVQSPPTILDRGTCRDINFRS